MSLPLLACRANAASRPPEEALVTAREAMTPERWRQDLTTMMAELARRHPAPHHAVSPESLRAAAEALEADVARLAAHEIIVRMAGIVAMIGDAHTYLDLPATGPFGFHDLPVRFQAFGDGLFVTAATPRYRDTLGRRVVRLGGLPVGEAWERARRVVSVDNESTARFLVPRRLAKAEVLHAIGAIDDLARVPIEIEEKQGIRRIVALVLPERSADLEWIEGREGGDGPVSPFWRNNEREYWLEYLEDRRTLYLQFNSVAERPDEPMAAFAKRLLESLEKHPVDRLVIDLRRNIGGNWRITIPLIRAIIRSGRFEEPGRLFTLIGPASISATVVFALELNRYTANVFVGEPSGSRPNQYGENEFFTLPRSGLSVSYASAYFQTAGPFDESEWIAPEIAVEMSSSDYFAGRDPVMQAVFDYEPQPRLGEALKRIIEDGGIEAAAAHYRRYKDDPRNRYVDTERDVRRLAGEMLESDRAGAALALHRMNLESYPRRARAHLGLALAYRGLEREGEARKELERALSLIPEDRSLYNALRHRLEELTLELLRDSTTP